MEIESRRILQPDGGISAISYAEHLFTQQSEWQLEKFDVATDLAQTLPDVLRAKTEALGNPLSQNQLQTTHRFIHRMITNSPMPPIDLEGFIDQLVVAQVSGGKIPMVFQGIACLNYLVVEHALAYHSRKDLLVLPISNTQTKKRWGRFMGETSDMQSFLLGLTEIGVRPLVVFGVSDVLNFEGEELFSQNSERLYESVEQNRITMHEGVEALNGFFKTVPIADPALRPQLRAFDHSQLLKDVHGEHHTKNVEVVNAKTTELEAFRNWQFRRFLKIFNRNNDNPGNMVTQAKMMALYATDNERSREVAKLLFPEEPISAVTSLSLQPLKTWEWIEEKIGCYLVNIPITQLSPFPNAGSWHDTGSVSLPFDIRGEFQLHGKSPKDAFQHLIRIEDAELLPGINLAAMSGNDVMRKKEIATINLLTATYGEEYAMEGLSAYRQRQKKK